MIFVDGLFWGSVVEEGVEPGVVPWEGVVVVAPGASLEGGLEKGLVVGWRGRVYCFVGGYGLVGVR